MRTTAALTCHLNISRAVLIPAGTPIPGKARTSGAVDRLSRRIERSDDDSARQAVTEFWQGPWAETIMNMPDTRSIYMPLAVSALVQDRLKAITPVIAITHATAKAKFDKRKQEGNQLGPEQMAAVQEAIEDPVAIVEEGREENVFLVFVRIDGKLWRIPVVKSGPGFLARPDNATRQSPGRAAGIA